MPPGKAAQEVEEGEEGEEHKKELWTRLHVHTTFTWSVSLVFFRLQKYAGDRQDQLKRTKMDFNDRLIPFDV